MGIHYLCCLWLHCRHIRELRKMTEQDSGYIINPDGSVTRKHKSPNSGHNNGSNNNTNGGGSNSGCGVTFVCAAIILTIFVFLNERANSVANDNNSPNVTPINPVEEVIDSIAPTETVIELVDPITEEVYISQEPPSPAPMSASIENVWLSHGVLFNGQRGMMIHTRFKCDNSLNQKIYLRVDFYYRDNITPLTNPYGYDLIIQNSATCDYEYTTFMDFQSFLPYDDIYIDDVDIISLGLTFNVSIYDSDMNLLTKKNDFAFTFTRNNG